jgi:hypothetical protein
VFRFAEFEKDEEGEQGLAGGEYRHRLPGLNEPRGDGC